MRTTFKLSTKTTICFIIALVAVILAITAFSQTQKVLITVVTNVTDQAIRPQMREEVEKAFRGPGSAALIRDPRENPGGSSCFELLFPFITPTRQDRNDLEDGLRQAGGDAGQNLGDALGQAGGQVFNNAGVASGPMNTITRGAGNVFGRTIKRGIVGGGSDWSGDWSLSVATRSGCMQPRVTADDAISLRVKLGKSHDHYEIEEVGNPQDDHLTKLKQGITFGTVKKQGPTEAEVALGVLKVIVASASGRLHDKSGKNISLQAAAEFKAVRDRHLSPLVALPAGTDVRAIGENTELLKLREENEKTRLELEKARLDLERAKLLAQSPTAQATQSLRPINPTQQPSYPPVTLDEALVAKWAATGPFTQDLDYTGNENINIVGPGIDELLGHLVAERYLIWRKPTKGTWCRRFAGNAKSALMLRQQAALTQNPELAAKFGVRATGSLDRNTRAYLNYLYSLQPSKFVKLQNLRPDESRSCDVLR